MEVLAVGEAGAEQERRQLLVGVGAELVGDVVGADRGLVTVEQDMPEGAVLKGGEIPRQVRDRPVGAGVSEGQVGGAVAAGIAGDRRIRSDQADRLAEHVRRLNRVRTHRNGSVGERITDNTLIRVAIDWLLARADELAGTTEDELLNSVSR